MEHVRPLPAHLGAEHRPRRGQRVVQRRDPLRAPRLDLAVGPRDRVVQPEDLRHPGPQPGVVAVERREPAYVDTDQVHRRLAGHDPLGQRPPGAAGRGDAHGVEPGTDVVAVELGGRPEQELVVGGERLRPVVELADPGLGQRGHPDQGLVHQHREVVPVLLQQLELERVRQVVGRAPRLRIGLEPTDHETADLLLEVRPPVGVAHDREVGVAALDGVGDDVEVLGRVQAARSPRPGRRAPWPTGRRSSPRSRSRSGAPRRPGRSGPLGPGGRAADSSTSTSSTRVFSAMVTPRIRAPFASDWVTSVGFTFPSPGSQRAPRRSSTRIAGHSSWARAGPTTSHSMS